MRAVFVLLSLLLLPLSLSAAEKLKVVTSFSILADMASQVGGERIQVTTIVGPDTDAHTYQPTGDDAKKLLKADVIIENGLGFEPWMSHLMSSSGTKKPLVVASAGVTPRTLEENGTSVSDPHAWQNLSNAELYVNNIAVALGAADPANAKAYISRGKTYIKQLHALLVEARTKIGTMPVGAMPAGSRRFVTSHAAFGYLGKSYEIEFIAPQGVSTEREPSAADVTALVARIRDTKVKALFTDNTEDPALLQQIAEQSGTKVGGILYSDALELKGPASTFTGMYETNLNTLHDALGQP